MQTREFGTTLPKIIKISKNENRTIVFNKITGSKIVLEKNSSLTLVAVTDSGCKKTQKLSIKFVGENSKLTFTAIIIGKNFDSFNFETETLHMAAKTTASINVFSALSDSSSVNYKGLITIEKEGIKTNSHLSHKTILLSENTHVETTPSLEIKTDDVSAGHSAFIGRLDKNLLFYLQSRGIDEKKAKKLMIQGFFNNAVNSISDKIVRKILAEEIQNSLSRDKI